MESVVDISCVEGFNRMIISPYSSIKGSAALQTSPKIKVAGLEWEMLFYPAGRRQDLKGKFFSVGILLNGKFNDVRAMIEVSLVNQRGGLPWVKGTVTNRKHAVTLRKSGTVKKANSCYCDKFIERRRAEQQSSGFLFEDRFVMETKIHVIVSFPSRVYHMPQNEHSSVVQALTEILRERDYILEIKGVRFPVHRRLVEMRCPLLLASDGLDTLEVDVFEAVMHFLYKDELMPGFSSSVSSITNLIKAASKLKLAKLATFSEIRLCQQLCKENCIKGLMLAKDMRLELLKEACLNFIQHQHIITSGHMSGLNDWSDIMNQQGNVELQKEIREALGKAMEMAFGVGDRTPGDEHS